MAITKVMPGIRLIIAVAKVAEVRTKLAANKFCAIEPLR